MPLHPEADAFVQAILRDPTEVTGRLAFADWLQDQGGVPNLAWAYYIRLQIEIAECEAQGKECGNLRREAQSHAPYIQGKVTVPASLICTSHDVIVKVLPPERCTVTLGDWDIPPSVFESVPINFGGPCTYVPLSRRGNSVVVATQAPRHASLKVLEREHGIVITALKANSKEIATVLSSLLSGRPPDRQ